MMFLREDTAATVQIGPFLDDGDGNTVEGALTITQADVRLSKNGGNIAQKSDATSCTHDELGMYTCPLDATDTNTAGRLQLIVHESGALSVWHEFTVLPTQVYDSLVLGTDALQVHANEMTADLINAAAIADNAIDNATFAAETGMASVRSNTATAGGAASVTLDASASTTSGFYVGAWIVLTGGTGVGQTRVCVAYNGTSKVASVSPSWATQPVNGTTFAVLPSGWVGGSYDLGPDAIDTTSVADGAITAAKIATDAIGSDEVAAAGANKIADHVLRRTFANARTSSDGDSVSFRSLLGGLAKLVNRVAISGATLTAYQENDTTSMGTQAVTTDSGADPITELDTT
jgi:hypothetical protein